MTIDDWIMSVPLKDRLFIAQTTLDVWDLFVELEQKSFLKKTLRSQERKDFPEVLRTSDGLIDAFNMLFSIPTPEREFIAGRNRDFIEHNRQYGFSDARYAFLLLSESMSAFQRNVELFRACLLSVIETKPKKDRKKYPFWDTMGTGELLNQLVNICGNQGLIIKNKINYDLRNALSHGLVWQKGFTIHYSKDITFAPNSRGEIRLDKLWIHARVQSKITQCLIKSIVEWYS